MSDAIKSVVRDNVGFQQVHRCGTGCDVVDGSADTVDELISMSKAIATVYTSRFFRAVTTPSL